MKKLLRIALAAALAALVLIATCAAILYYEQDRVIGAVLQSVDRQSGVRIEPRTAHLELHRHLLVVLEQPRVFSAERELVSLGEIRALVNYRSIVFTRGLPLRALQLKHPVLKLPFVVPKGGAGFPRPNADSIKTALEVLAKVSAVARRIDIDAFELSDESGTPIVSGANVNAFRTRRAPRLWNVGAECDLAYPPLAGMHAAASVKIGVGAGMPEHTALKGQIWYWRLPLEHVSLGNFTVSGRSHGELSLSVRDDASIDGSTGIGFREVVVTSPDLSGPLELGNFSLEARFKTSAERLVLSAATLRYENRPVAAADAQVLEPYAPNPRVGFSVEGIRVAWSDLLARIRELKRVPQQVEALAAHMKAGRIEVARASLETSLDILKKIDPAALLHQLTFNATLRDVAFAPPRDTELPEVTDAGCQIFFAKGVLTASQGSARLGNSLLSDASAELDLSRGLATVPYKLTLRADGDMNELRPAAMHLLEHYRIEQRGRLSAMSGELRAELQASGVLRKDATDRPRSYLAKFEPRNLRFEVRGAPGPVVIESGTVEVEPDVIRINRLSANATGGTAQFDGDLRIGPARVETHGITIDVHQMPVERWLPLAVDPDNLSAAGLIGGRLVLTSDRDQGILLNGKMILGSGKIALGFLRAPFIVGGATLTLGGHSLELSMPDSRLEGKPINFKVGVKDLRNPTIRIDAVAQDLDLEVMKFVRLPWSPPTPQHFFQNPVLGRVIARKANLEGFAMSNAKADFVYDRGNWRVYNLTARAYEGGLAMEISGRQQDDWMHLQPRLSNMNIAALILLNPRYKTPPLQGKLDLDADIWADTDNDFFSTMAGKLQVRVHDGVLNKFTLLSRLLGFIDLKSWLTAQVPDPRVAGLPFRELSGDFRGSDGVMYTDNLLVDGPVMDIIANGNVNVDQSTMEMTIGMIPFNTVNWLLSNIPLIGKNVAGGTESIIAAYFHASGPIADPKVRPAPITSVAELAKKLIGLPVNLIRPNTIK